MTKEEQLPSTDLEQFKHGIEEDLVKLDRVLEALHEREEVDLAPDVQTDHLIELFLDERNRLLGQLETLPNGPRRAG